MRPKRFLGTLAVSLTLVLELAWIALLVGGAFLLVG